MAHAGTMVGGSAQTKQSGSPWPAMALIVAVLIATIAGVWLASSAGRVGGTATPAANLSYDRYLDSVLDRAHAAPYTGAAVAPSSDRGLYLNGILDGAHAAPYAQSYDAYLNSVLDRAHAAPFTGDPAAQARSAYLNGILDGAHAAPYAGGAALWYDSYLNGILDRAHAAPFTGDAVARPLGTTSDKLRHHK